MAETTQTRSTDDLPPMPKATITVYVILTTIGVFGLGMAVGGHEWQRIGLQTGIVLVAGAVALAICTGLMHLAYSAGWKKRGMVVGAPQANARDLSAADQPAPAESTEPATSEANADAEEGDGGAAPVPEPHRHVIEAGHNGRKVPVGSR